MPLLLLALVSMLLQQTMATVAKTAVPVMFKAIADDLGFDSELVLVFTWVLAIVAVIGMLGCGAFINRFGALRVSQVSCVLMAIGLVIVSTANGVPMVALLILCLAGMVMSLGVVAATPASSQILARYSPAKWSPLVFSVKQAGVPAGVALASFVIPLLILAMGWRMAALVLAGACIAIAIVLQPCRAEFDRDRNPKAALRLASLRQNVMSVLSEPELRTLAAAGFAFIGMQSIYVNYTVVYLTEEMGYDLERAGAALGLATLIAAPGRIFWGWIGSTLIAPRHVLALLALVMTVACIAMGRFDPAWSQGWIMVPLVGVSATALSWHGLLLSEIARIAAAAGVPQLTGQMTGGVLAFGSAAQTLFPLLFGLGYLIAGYTGAFFLTALPAFVVGVVLIKSRGTPAPAD